MNQAQRRAIETAIGNAADNLYRAKLQKKRDPNWVSGNDETIDEVITQYQKQINDLKGDSQYLKGGSK